MLDWLYNNREWLLSGLGVAIVGAFIRLIWSRRSTNANAELIQTADKVEGDQVQAGAGNAGTQTQHAGKVSGSQVQSGGNVRIRKGK